MCAALQVLENSGVTLKDVEAHLAKFNPEAYDAYLRALEAREAEAAAAAAAAQV